MNIEQLDKRLAHCISMCNSIMDNPKPGDSSSLAEEVKFLAEVIRQESRTKVSPDA